MVPGRGLPLHLSQTFGRRKALQGAGTVVVPGWKGADVLPSAELVSALRAAHASGARLVTICSGVFVLAAAGLLDGRRATTHWRYAETLRQRYPASRWIPMSSMSTRGRS